MTQVNIALFASGGGSNVQKIIDHFRFHPSIKVALIVFNKPQAGVVDIAKHEGIELCLVNKVSFYNTTELLDTFEKKDIKFIALAGFLWLIPSYLVNAFPKRILNIHPSLLPLYGGKGMYGHFVHEAVKANKEPFSGMTIHVVNELYDDGDIVFQAKCSLSPTMSADEIAQEVLKLEHLHYGPTIETFIKSSNIS